MKLESRIVHQMPSHHMMSSPHFNVCIWKWCELIQCCVLAGYPKMRYYYFAVWNQDLECWVTKVCMLSFPKFVCNPSPLFVYTHLSKPQCKLHLSSLWPLMPTGCVNIIAKCGTLPWPTAHCHSEVAWFRGIFIEWLLCMIIAK